jgi:hypothetical protein
MVALYRLRRLTVCCLLLATALACSGCKIFGAAAAVVVPPDEAPEPQRYENLAGQTCAVWVWADPATRTDFFDVRGDLASAIQTRLVQEGRDGLKRDQLKGTQFPFPARSVVQFQDRNPNLQYQPIEKAVLAMDIPKLSRVICVELNRLETRYPKSRDLYRGSAEATLRIVEIDGGRTAKVAFTEPGIKVLYPATGPEAWPESDQINDQIVYSQTIASLAHEICRRLYPPKRD